MELATVFPGMQGNAQEQNMVLAVILLEEEGHIQSCKPYVIVVVEQA